MKRRILTLMLILSLLLLLLAGCGKTEDSNAQDGGGDAVPEDENAPETTDNNPLVTITMDTGDKIYIELYPDKAPNTVNNFISLIQQGYYDGLTFHRVIEGLIIQGGDPNGNGTGGPGYEIVGEVSSNGYDNDLSHTKGVISMARKATGYDTAGSQFFIMAGDYPAWDGEYCAFGMVIQGIEIVEELAATPLSDSGAPSETLTMETVTVNTFGIDSPEPEIIQ